MRCSSLGKFCNVSKYVEVVVTVAHTSYKVNEKDHFANITVLLDQPSCEAVTVIAVPQVQSPVDASSKINVFSFSYYFNV